VFVDEPFVRLSSNLRIRKERKEFYGYSTAEIFLNLNQSLILGSRWKNHPNQVACNTYL